MKEKSIETACARRATCVVMAVEALEPLKPGSGVSYHLDSSTPVVDNRRLATLCALRKGSTSGKCLSGQVARQLGRHPSRALTGGPAAVPGGEQ